MTDMKRRKAMALTAGTILLPLAALGARSSRAAEPLDPAAPAAAALGYVTMSEVEDQNCTNCQLYMADGETGYGACSIFPGNVVAAEAWCKAWIKRAV